MLDRGDLLVREFTIRGYTVFLISKFRNIYDVSADARDSGILITSFI